MKLPDIARKQRAAEEKLSDLHQSIQKLAVAHHALAADAQGKTPEALSDKLADLAAAAKDLGKYYSSLSAN